MSTQRRRDIDEWSDDEILAAHGLTRDQVHIRERRVDDVLVQDTVTPNFRVAFIRLQQGTVPVNTLRGECHVDIDADGNILGVTVEVSR